MSRITARGALVAALLLASCGGQGSGPPARRIKVSSPAFAPGSSIPRQYTCDGADTSPPLRWSRVPKATTTLSLLMRDPDAPGGNFIHWRLSQIPRSAGGLPVGRVPPGTVQGVNSSGRTGYGGPCPPRGGGPHHYVITITALHSRQPIAAGTLTGTYARR